MEVKRRLSGEVDMMMNARDHSEFPRLLGSPVWDGRWSSLRVDGTLIRPRNEPNMYRHLPVKGR